jgi:hypothetical protein
MKQFRQRRKEFEDARSNKLFLIAADAQPEYTHDCSNSSTQKICSDLDDIIRCPVGVRGGMGVNASERWRAKSLGGEEKAARTPLQRG